MRKSLSISVLMLAMISSFSFGQNLIKGTHFPQERIEMPTKNDWQKFWDEYGLGRYNSSGAKTSTSPMIAENGILTVPFDSGDAGGSPYQTGGAMIYQSEPRFESKELYMEFTVKFSKDFDWGEVDEKYRGGKFGAAVTVNNVGVGDAPPAYGFQYTTMWRGGGKLDAYIYHDAQPDNWPDHLIFGQIVRDRWYKFGIHIITNEVGKRNGSVEIYVDDQKQYERFDLRFSEKTGTSPWNPSFSTFFGGSGIGWRARNTCDIQFGNVYYLDGMPSNPDWNNATASTFIPVQSVRPSCGFESPFRSGRQLVTPPGTAWIVYQLDGRVVSHIPVGTRSITLGHSIADKVLCIVPAKGSGNGSFSPATIYPLNAE